MKNNPKKYKNIITFALIISLLTSGCSITNKKHDKYTFYQTISGEKLVRRDDYIEHQYINKYYVIEIHNWVINKTSILIAEKFDFTNGKDDEITYSKYTNIFTNNTIAYEPNDENSYNLINITPLEDYLEEYNLEKDKYTYEDMQYIYKIIKENYNKNTKTLKLTLNNI